MSSTTIKVHFKQATVKIYDPIEDEAHMLTERSE